MELFTCVSCKLRSCFFAWQHSEFTFGGQPSKSDCSQAKATGSIVVNSFVGLGLQGDSIFDIHRDRGKDFAFRRKDDVRHKENDRNLPNLR